MINAGKYDKKIKIYSVTVVEDSEGFQTKTTTVVWEPYANVKTTKGFTLIANGTDFEKAFTRFTIRYPSIAITRDMFVEFNSKTYTIEYINNIDEKDVELELQCKEVTL